MIKRTQVQDTTTQRAIEDVRVQSNDWAAKELSGYAWVEENGSRDIEVTASGVKRLKHKLGRKLTGWKVVDMFDGLATVYRVSTDSGDTANDKTDLWLSFSAATTVRIIAF